MNPLSSVKIFSVLFAAFICKPADTSLFSQEPEIRDTTDYARFEKQYETRDGLYQFINLTCTLKQVNPLLPGILYVPENSLTEDSYCVTTVHSRLKINTRSGIEKYAFVYLNKEQKSHLKQLEARTIKPDGSVIILDTTQIFKTNIPFEDEEDKQYDQLRFAIPGVEVGDLIELHYTIEDQPATLREQYGTIFMHQELPVVNSSYDVVVPASVNIVYKQYNGFPDPEIIETDTNITCRFMLKYLNPVRMLQYSCPACELPYVSYYFIYDQNKMAREWKDVFNYDFNALTLPLAMDNEKASFYQKWKKNLLKNAGDSSEYYQLRILLDAIIQGIEVRDLEPQELNKNMGYYLYNGYIDPLSVRRLYRQILDDLGIEYWACFAKNKWMGPLDPVFIRSNDITDLFFLLEENGKPGKYLYPHNTLYKFQLNEIPTHLYNTAAIIIKPYKDPDVKKASPIYSFFPDSVIIQQIILRAGNSNLNYAKHQIYCDADLSAKEHSFKSDFTISGGVSTRYRLIFSYLASNEEINELFRTMMGYTGDDSPLEVETILKRDLKHIYPFKYTVLAAGHLKKGMDYLNDSIRSINLHDFILHDQIFSEDDSIDLAYNLEYAYTDIMQFFISFSKPVEIINLSSFNNQISNEIGEYNCNVSVSDNQRIIITSKYSTKKDVITSEEYAQLRDLNQTLKDTRSSRLIIKILD